jgi:DNA-binding GntR family transcriptional regulator
MVRWCQRSPSIIDERSASTRHRVALEEVRRERAGDGTVRNARYVRVGSRLHQLIASASGIPVPSLFNPALGPTTAQPDCRNVYRPSEHGRVHQHLDIVDAPLDRDAVTAGRLVAEHMSDMRITHGARYPGMTDNAFRYVI